MGNASFVPPTARNFPPETKLFAAHLYGFNEGVEFGYRIAMLALANKNAIYKMEIRS